MCHMDATSTLNGNSKHRLITLISSKRRGFCTHFPFTVFPVILILLVIIRAGNQEGRAGLGRANSGLGQNRTGPKLIRIFRAKILVAQPTLKTRLVEPNSLLKAKKNRADRAGSGHTGASHTRPAGPY